MALITIKIFIGINVKKLPKLKIKEAFYPFKLRQSWSIECYFLANRKTHHNNIKQQNYKKMSGLETNLKNMKPRPHDFETETAKR